MTVKLGDRELEIPAPCRKCWQCRRRRVDDYVGRCLAEASTSSAVSVITLTYAPRTDGYDQRVNSRHFQSFIRAVRDRGHLVRYLGVAERGTRSTKRVHFHALLFWQGDPPDWARHRGYTHIQEWPHGHVYLDDGSTERAARYACKYLLKGESDASNWYTLSKKPPLGFQFFVRLAASMAETGHTPQTLTYRVGDVPRVFYMTGATRRMFIHTLEQFLDARGGRRYTPSDAYDASRDAHARHEARRSENYDLAAEAERLRKQLDERRPSRDSIAKMLERLDFADAWAAYHEAQDGETS